MPGPVLRILVLEDHPSLGRFIAAALGAVGWAIVGPIADCTEGLAAAREAACDAALLDRVLRGEEAAPIAEALAARGIPCVVMSGYPRATLPAPLSGLPFLEKPFTTEALIAALRAALGDAGPET